MKIVVFTPTIRYGGLDVTFSCLKHQEGVDNFDVTWFLVDELRQERPHVFDDINDEWFKIHIASVSKQKGMDRNLSSSYQAAIEYARSVDADLLISLQDYIWIPDNGIKQFADFSRECEGLLTGLCHHSITPTALDVVDPKGKFTIFEEPWNGRKPQGESWHDIREEGVLAPYIIDPVRWEANWCAITREPLHDLDLNYDISYDIGIAYENQDYALKAKEKGYDVYILEANTAISFPHRTYWPDDAVLDDALTKINQRKHHEKWQIDMPT